MTRTAPFPLRNGAVLLYYQPMTKNQGMSNNAIERTPAELIIEVTLAEMANGNPRREAHRLAGLKCRSTFGDKMTINYAATLPAAMKREILRVKEYC